MNDYGTAAYVYGVTPTYIGAVPKDTALTATDAASSARGFKAMLDPGKPLLWLAIIVAVTVGAAGVAGSVKLGPAKIGGSVGKTS